jgi:hypothetical protein
MQAFAPRQQRELEARDLPMINGKKNSEFVETSLIYLLSAAVGAFALVWLISLLLGSGRG